MAPARRERRVVVTDDVRACRLPDHEAVVPDGGGCSGIILVPRGYGRNEKPIPAHHRSAGSEPRRPANKSAPTPGRGVETAVVTEVAHTDVLRANRSSPPGRAAASR